MLAEGCLKASVQQQPTGSAQAGYGVPVGSVVVTDSTVIQAASGYDISCGVLYMKVPDLSAERVADRRLRERWVREVEKRVATGIGSQRPKLAPKVTRHAPLSSSLRDFAQSSA